MSLRMTPMPSRSILVRVALLTGLLVGLVALADGVVRKQLEQATVDMASLPAIETTRAIR
jgi:hypothetical protein